MTGSSKALPKRHNNCAVCLPDQLEYSFSTLPAKAGFPQWPAAVTFWRLATPWVAPRQRCMPASWQCASAYLANHCIASCCCKAVCLGRPVGVQSTACLEGGAVCKGPGCLQDALYAVQPGNALHTLAGQGVEECARAKSDNGQLWAAASWQHALCPGLRYIACASCLPA